MASVKPKYEESQFADFFRDEMRQKNNPRSKFVFAPIGQVLEAKLGWDAAYWLSKTHPAWSDIGPSGLPGTVRSDWNVTLTPNDAITGKALNVFIQFKRSHHLTRSYAKYFHIFNRDYWQFWVDRSDNPDSLPQHELLEKLEQNTAGRSIVRYVAPLSHEYGHLEQLADSRTLTENCVYVRPSEFKPDHMTCVFVAPGDTYVNPGPVKASAESWNSLQASLVSADFSVGSSLVDDALEALADYDLRNPSDLIGRWSLPTTAAPGIKATVAKYLVAAERLYRSNIAWFAAFDLSEQETATKRSEMARPQNAAITNPATSSRSPATGS